MIDGNGHTLQGTGSDQGFGFVCVNNVTIKNVNIKAFQTDIEINGSSHVTIIHNNITENSNDAYFLDSSNNTVSGNMFVGNGFAMSLHVVSG